MNALTEQIKEGIVHPAGPQVRLAAVRHFANAFSADPGVMPRVIEAVQKLGRDGAFDYLPRIERLAQTEATLEWAIQELGQFPDNTDDEWAILLGQLLAEADPQLLHPRREEILNIPALSRDAADLVRLRTDLPAWDAERCWREVDEFCERYKNEMYPEDLPLARAFAIVERLAREPELPFERISAPLSQEFEDLVGNPLSWMQPLIARLAGAAHSEAAIPLLVAKLHGEDDVLANECCEALIKIGSDAAVDALANEYAAGDYGFRLLATGPLGDIRTSKALQTGLRLLGIEKSTDIRTFLAQGVIGQLAPEAIAAVRPIALANDYDYMVADLREEVVIACTLLDEQIPELDAWKAEVEQAWREIREQSAEIARELEAKIRSASSPPKKRPRAYEDQSHPAYEDRPRPDPVPPRLAPVHAHHNVGRNEPCPCGSGKKFKKCCMRKEA